MAFAELYESPVSVKALVLISVSHHGSDFRPLFWQSLIELKELAILLVSPSLDLPLGELMIFLTNLHVHLPAIFRDNGDHELSLHFFYKIISFPYSISN